MTKTLTAGFALAVLFGASIASAQTYATTGACVAITRDLTPGSRGADVVALQRFLVAQNYPGGGTWMLTGKYGAATAAAVRNFQQLHNLAQTGSADAATRSLIASCGISNSYVTSYPQTSYGYPYTPYPYAQNQYQYPYNQNPYTPYPYNYQYGTPHITSVNPTTAAVGATVTIDGSGFDLANNTISVNGATVANVPSWNGTTLTFTVPFVNVGAMQVYVVNSRGTSNALPLTVNSYVTCTTYSYNTCYGGVTNISFLSPQSGAVGATVTVFGSGFSSSNNSVRFGNGIIAALGSSDGQTLSFTVPSSLTGYGSQTVGLGTYYVSVANSAGQVSNALPFTVTSLGSTGAPMIQALNGPTSVAAGTANTWSATVSNPANTNVNVSVDFGDTGVAGSPSAPPQTMYLQGQSTLSFSHTYLTAGTYTIRFTATNGQSQNATATMTVTVNGAANTQTSLSSLSPSSGRVGSQVILSGSGFTSDNTVHFGQGGTMHVYAANSNTIYYTIPSYVSPCDLTQGYGCGAAAQQVTPGAYSIYVTNANGTTQQLTFTVTS